MNGVILAAGRGSRLKGFSEDKPKCLNMVGNQTMLHYQLTALKNGGVDNTSIVTGYKSDMLDGFADETFHNPNWENTNMVSSLLCASDIFNEPAIVSYSDIVYESNIVSRLMKEKQEVVIVYDEEWLALWKRRFEDPLADAESFVIDRDGRIREIGQKVKDVNKIEGQYTGLMLFSEKGLLWIKDFISRQDDEVARKMDMTTLLRSLINEGKPVYGMPIKGGWFEIDTGNDLSIANDMYNDGALLAGR